MKKLEFNIDEIKQFIINNKNAKIYFGCDSIRLRNYVRYATVVCIHYEGNHGAKVFGEITYDKTKDAKLSKPINRMLNEVNRVIDIYQKLEDILIERIDNVEIHIDVNPDENAGSNVAYGAAKGIVQGMIGIMPKFKPFAFASSCTADKYCKMGKK